MIRCGGCKGYHPTVAEVRRCCSPHRQKQPVPQAAFDALRESPPPGFPAKMGKDEALSAHHDLPDVEAGRYAVEDNGTLKFYQVDRPTEGKWAGYTFVKVQASDDTYPVKGHGRRRVLELIAKDPKAAMIRYGKEIGSCGKCGRTLTDEESRRMGIGPICAQKMGW